MASWEDRFVRILESDDWIIDYDKEKRKYRVSYFEEFHFVDEIWFDAYEDKEIHVPDEESLLKTLKSSKLKSYSQEERMETDKKLDEVFKSESVKIKKLPKFIYKQNP